MQASSKWLVSMVRGDGRVKCKIFDWQFQNDFEVLLELVFFKNYLKENIEEKNILAIIYFGKSLIWEGVLWRHSDVIWRGYLYWYQWMKMTNGFTFVKKVMLQGSNRKWHRLIQSAVGGRGAENGSGGRGIVVIKELFSDFNNIFLWNESEDITIKSLLSKFSWFQFYVYKLCMLMCIGITP